LKRKKEDLFMFKYYNATPERIRYYAEKFHCLAEEYYCTIEEKNCELLEFLKGDLSEFLQGDGYNNSALYDRVILENLLAVDKVKHSVSELMESMNSTGYCLCQVSDELEKVLSLGGSTSMGDKLI
jgi:hypothetical protein